MNNALERKLVEINRGFYQTVGTYFDASREYFWPGWEALLPHISKLLDQCEQENRALRVADIGAGNARFLEFLVKRFPGKRIEYMAIDNSEALMAKAEKRVAGICTNESNVSLLGLFVQEIVFENWGEAVKAKLEAKNQPFENSFDLVVAFGVMHHIPGKANREKLLKQTRNLLNSNGIGVITLWKYLDIERLKKRLISKTTDEGLEIYKKLGVNPQEMGEHDNILDWHRGIVSYRYSHYATDQEAEELLEKANLKLVDSYRHDAKEEVVNRYLVVKNA